MGFPGPRAAVAARRSSAHAGQFELAAPAGCNFGGYDVVMSTY
jgi:hypothetical protein